MIRVHAFVNDCLNFLYWFSLNVSRVETWYLFLWLTYYILYTSSNIIWHTHYYLWINQFKYKARGRIKVDQYTDFSLWTMVIYISIRVYWWLTTSNYYEIWYMHYCTEIKCTLSNINPMKYYENKEFRIIIY